MCISLFTATINAATLKCQFDGKTSQCHNFTLTPINFKNELIEVRKAPFKPYIDDITFTLWLTREAQFEFNEFPSQLFNIFTNIRTFVGMNFSMTELGKNSFTNCKKLELIELRYCDIKYIRQGFAKTCSELIEIKIIKSYLKSIDAKAFEGLLSLKLLTIVESSLKFIPSKIFENLPLLKHANFDGNRIAYIPNLNLNTTGTYEEFLLIQFHDNPIKAIYPLLLTSLIQGRMALSPVVITFHPSSQRKTSTCIDYNNLPNFDEDLYSIGSNKNWEKQNKIYQKSTTCYSAFTPKMEAESSGIEESLLQKNKKSD